ncbi:hypothetical protein ACM7MN_30595, partial [Pseudomonas paraeruginosa]|uniref:hypothetical protein n=2 Tax=Pseudomonas TaxID=286 RepID=UPI0039FC1854
ILLELTGQTGRTIYRQSIGDITANMSIVVPGFDPARGVVFFLASGNNNGFVPTYGVSGNMIIFNRGGSSATTYVLHAVMFS